MTRDIQLPWTRPLLTANQRLHWREKAERTRTIRIAVRLLAKNALLPKALPWCAVELHYRQPDRRKRDDDNLSPLLKVCCDALVDYGLVKDDTPAFMAKTMPVLHPAVKGQPAEMWLRVSWGPRPETIPYPGLGEFTQETQ